MPVGFRESLTMRITIVPILLSIFLLAGCREPIADSLVEPPPASAASPTESEESTEVEGRVGITPDNTTIEFVGTHAPGKTEPRKGEFNKFMGHVELAEQELTAIRVDIDTTSVTTEIENLTKHLKSPDFFDINEHPHAKFESTKIESTGSGTAQVTGEMTLLGTTETIEFPVTYSTNDGFTLVADFVIDRTKFGMDYGSDKVEKEVQIIISVGK
jgi:polyisoprenoid-binding protein YceI